MSKKSKSQKKQQAPAATAALTITARTFEFDASLSALRIDGDGEAKLTLCIPQTEIKKMAELSLFNGVLFSVGIVVVPDTVKPPTYRQGD